MPSLREIENTIATLWLDERARQWLLVGRKKGQPAPPSLAGAPASVLAEADREGIKLYGGLLNFGHHDVMDSVYPFCRRLLGKKWEQVVDDYLLKFPPDHYNFNRLCSRFPEYCTTYGGDLLSRAPYLPELADYEWIELEKMELDVEIPAAAQIDLSNQALLATHGPVVNPTLTVRKYSYDIPAIAERIENGQNPARTVAAETTYVAIYRHPQSQLCRFLALESGAAELVQAALAKPHSYQDLIAMAVRIASPCDPVEAVSDLLQLLEDLNESRLLVGSAPLTS